jgi:hypothetical protein
MFTVGCVAALVLSGSPLMVKFGVPGRVTAIDSVLLVVAPLLSVTVTETEEVPGADGVPERLPLELMLTPAGRPEADHW